jgi:hypothetical protein
MLRLRSATPLTIRISDLLCGSHGHLGRDADFPCPARKVSIAVTLAVKPPSRR